LGRANAAVFVAGKVTIASSGLNQRVVRLCFGSWGLGINGASNKRAQQLAVVESGGGEMLSYNFTSDLSKQFKRVRALGLCSHLEAQEDALLRWFQASASDHAIIIRIADDTNMWIQSRKPDTKNMLGQAQGQEGQIAQTDVSSVKKTAQVLGLIERVALRRTHQGQPFMMDIVQVHSPNQVLPQANAYTILSRMQKWCSLSSAGSSSFFGGG
jgi:hypothetical protein